MIVPTSAPLLAEKTISTANAELAGHWLASTGKVTLASPPGARVPTVTGNDAVICATHDESPAVCTSAKPVIKERQ
jgi:hypothetical protein